MTSPDAVLGRILAINSAYTSSTYVEKVDALLRTVYAADVGRDPALVDTLEAYAVARSRGLPYCDIRVAARLLSAIIRPASYLEIGTRRGWSLAQVFAEAPGVTAYVCDLWIEGYGGFDQGTPAFIVEVLRRAVPQIERPTVSFLSGNSHDILRDWFEGKLQDLPTAPREFDLVALDGDHSRVGVWWDLLDVVDRVAVGGALIFDDLDELGHGEASPVPTSTYERQPLPGSVDTLMDLWLYFQSKYPNFVCWTNVQGKLGAGIALRVQ
ncbi:MAG TPA: class I SAM-dependent methyltransferase [Acidimicrobiales bacterium]|nr:class I SAM-dependent methyltransferase [Acidimicrobiales bacterium]